METINFLDFSLQVLNIDNYKFVNGLPHFLKFDNNFELKGNPDFAKMIKAESNFIEKTNENGIIFGNIKYSPNKETEELIKQFKEEYPDVKIITSQITVNSADDSVFVSPITTKETERSPPNEKINFTMKRT